MRLQYDITSVGVKYQKPTISLDSYTVRPLSKSYQVTATIYIVGEGGHDSIEDIEFVTDDVSPWNILVESEKRMREKNAGR